MANQFVVGAVEILRTFIRQLKQKSLESFAETSVAVRGYRNVFRSAKKQQSTLMNRSEGECPAPLVNLQWSANPLIRARQAKSIPMSF